MSPDISKTTIKFITALLKHQAKLWLGEETVGIAAETLIDEDLQKRLDDWLQSDETAKKLLKASQQAQDYLLDPENCPDSDLRGVFHDVGFGDLPFIQKAVTGLPQSLDSGRIKQMLFDSFSRDFPNLSTEQHKEGARLYTYALLSAVGTLENYTLPIIRQVVIDNSKKLDALGIGQAEIRALLEKISSFITHPSSLQAASSPTLQGDLPFGSHLPFPRNGNFTGRTRDLEILADALLGEDSADVVVNQAITGMGGLGKTQLAVEFAYENGHEFQGVHWLDLREAKSLDEQIVFCGDKMGLANWPPTLPEQVIATMRAWLQNNPRLLILDNFEDPESVNEVLARLRHSGLRLLITSRRTDWNSALGLKRLPLDEFSPQESLDFLRKYIQEERESDEELAKLAEHLGRLPLGLELAGRYLQKQPRLRIEAYLIELEKALDHRSMQNWKAEIKSLTEHDLSLLQTFARSWELVQDAKAQKLFIASGYCAPNTPIPTRMHELVLAEDEKEACDECLADLLGLGLLKAGPSIHPLLAQFARRLDTDLEILKAFSDALGEVAAQVNKEESDSGNYALFSPILSHVRDVAGHSEEATLKSAGLLWNELGYHIKTLADHAGAKAAYERALKIDEASFGPDHPKVAIRLWWLGVLARDEGDKETARTLFERTLQIFKKFLPAEHPNIKSVQGFLDSL